MCVVSDSGPKQRVLYLLDPVKGKGRELLSTGPAPDFLRDTGWDVSPDGSSLAFLKSDPQGRAFRIEVRPLAGSAARELNVSGWANTNALRWAADGKGWFVTTWSPTGNTLLKVDLAGKVRVLGEGLGWWDPIPSPDGRHVAIRVNVPVMNVWMLENF